MRILLVQYVIFLHCSFICGQSTSVKCIEKLDSLTGTKVYTSADKMPEVVGGDSILMREFEKITYAQDICFSGKVYVAFIINAEGKITGKRIRNPETKRYELLQDTYKGIDQGMQHYFGAQILDLIENVKWQPGTCDGKPVPVLYILPMDMTLR